MSARSIARFTALGRVAIGAAFIARPQIWIRPWIGRDASRPGALVLARALGARDLVLGLGTLTSEDGELPRWLAAGVIADATDLAATVSARQRLPQRGAVFVTGLAGGAVALGLVSLVGTRRGG